MWTRPLLLLSLLMPCGLMPSGYRHPEDFRCDAGPASPDIAQGNGTGVESVEVPQGPSSDTSAPSLHAYPGDITIVGTDDFTGLAGYSSISGDLVVENTDLGGLEGLAGIERVDGFLVLRNNDLLASLAGLERLQVVGGDLVIEDNDHLTSLDGLGSLRIAGSLVLHLNRNLRDLSALNNLTQVGWYLSIEANFRLASLSALAGVSGVGGEVRIAFNDALGTLEGLEGLTTAGAMFIDHNRSLADLAGLRNLVRIEDALVIRDNLRLPMCAATEVEQRLVANGWSGTGQFANNRGDGPCPGTEAAGPIASHPPVFDPDRCLEISAPPTRDGQFRPYPQAWLEEARRRHQSNDCGHLVYADGCAVTRTGTVVIEVTLQADGRVDRIVEIENSIRVEPMLVFDCLRALVGAWRFHPPCGYSPSFTMRFLFSDMC